MDLDDLNYYYYRDDFFFWVDLDDWNDLEDWVDIGMTWMTTATRLLSGYFLKNHFLNCPIKLGTLRD